MNLKFAEGRWTVKKILICKKGSIFRVLSALNLFVNVTFLYYGRPHFESVLLPEEENRLTLFVLTEIQKVLMCVCAFCFWMVITSENCSASKDQVYKVDLKYIFICCDYIRLPTFLAWLYGGYVC